MKVTLVRHTDNPIDAMAQAASNCYDSEPLDTVVHKCHETGHHSVLEFADFHFHIEGVSRALSHQLVRHRMASYAQRSQRYVNEDGFKYVTPSSVEKVQIDISIFNPDNMLINLGLDYDGIMSLLDVCYSQLLEQGVPPEDARMILPNACETTIDMKMNFRTFMNFCNERLCASAQWEIRELARLMVKAVREVAPHLAPYLVPKCERTYPLCYCTEKKSKCCGRQPHISSLLSLLHPPKVTLD